MLAEKLPVMDEFTERVTIKFLSTPVPKANLRLIQKDSEAASKLLEQLQGIVDSKEKCAPIVSVLRRHILI